MMSGYEGVLSSHGQQEGASGTTARSTSITSF